MEFHFVEKKLSYADTQQKLTVTSELLHFLVPEPMPGYEENIEMVAEWGKSYTFRLRVRPFTQLGPHYIKAEFKQREWHAFILEKELREDDFVYFWRDPMTIRVKVKVPPSHQRLFGVNIMA